MTDLATLAVQIIPIDLIDASPLNPRKAFAPEKLQALGESIKTRGQLEAALVRPSPTKPGRYELANGERRWRAAKEAGVATLAAKVREMSDAEMVEVALAIGMGDNVESLTAIEEANGYAQLMKLRSLDQRALAAHLGRSPGHIARRLALRNLPPRAAAALEAGRLAARTAYYIASIPGEKARADAAEAILHSEIHGGVMPEGVALAYIRDHVCRPLRSAPFDQKDGELVPAAGPCTTCRFRAGCNQEEYGDIYDAKKPGGTDRCMHPACFDQKVDANRERLLAKHATGGKVALAKEENARVFPRDEHGINFASEFVDYNAKPTPDLLKKEVSPANAPTWRELTAEAAAPVTVYVGVDQDGRAVDLVKRDEAIAAADLAEQKIFNESQVKRGTVTKPGKPAGEAPATPSRAAEEKAEKQAKEKAERARRKRERQVGDCLDELCARIAETGKGRAMWHRLPFWTCLYEMVADALSVDELAFVVARVDPDGSEHTPARARLDGHASRLALPDFVALVARLISTPRLLSEGPEGATALAWHEALGQPAEEGAREADAEPTPPGVNEGERRELNEIAKAHMGGMSVIKIARVFRKSIPEVCGMLEIDPQEVYDERERLDEELGAAFFAAGVKQAAITPAIRGFLGAKHLDRASLAPEEFRHLIERLSKLAKPAEGAAKEFPETVEEGRVAPEARAHPRFEPVLCDRFADWFEEVFVGEDGETDEPAVLDREQAQEVIQAIVAEEDREQVGQFAEWLRSGSRLAQPGAAWAAEKLEIAIEKTPAKVA